MGAQPRGRTFADIRRSLRWGVAVGVWLGVADGAFALSGAGLIAERLGTMAVAVGLHAAVLALLFGVFGLLRGIVRLVFRSGGDREGRRPGRGIITVSGLGVLTGVLLACLPPLVLGSGNSVPPGDDPRPNVILISIDTLRPDHLGVYGYERETSPRLDAVAREGILFETAYSQASWTLPAHASLLTGLDPFAHGTVGEEDRLPGELETLAGRLGGAGYRTEAWVGTAPYGYVGAAYGLAAGFDAYRHYPHPKRFRSSLIARAVDGEILRRISRDVGNARAEIDSVIGWLRGSRSHPFFLFVHLYDVHSKSSRLPYEAPPPFLDRFCRDRLAGFSGCRAGRCASDRLLGMVKGEEPPFEEDEVELVRCLYDGGIAFVDHELGRLFDVLEEEGLDENTVVIVTSDHGEAFFEHDLPLHSTLHEEVTRVPLIVRMPGGISGKRMRGVVSLTDLAPTILELAGVGIPVELRGRSLVDTLREWRATADSDAIGVSPQRTFYRSGSLKLIEGGLSEHDPAAPPRELYDLTIDAEERENRTDWDQERAAGLGLALRARRDESLALRRRLLGGKPAERVELGESERARLRALGYLADGGVCSRATATADRPAQPSPVAPAGVSPATPSVLLITVDTLRADRLGVYGHRLATSPNIDALASRGTRFSDATVQWPRTWPSLASFLTGTYPRTTGIGVLPRVLPRSLTLLGELFRDAGVDTAAVVSNFNVGRRMGFDQGFDHFVESWQEKWREEAGSTEFVNAPGRVKDYTNATLVTDQALRWVRSRAGDDRPFFLWTHYMDPHGPYVPPAEFDELFQGEYAPSQIPRRLLPRYQGQYAAGQLITDLAFYQAQYDREIRYLDREIGRLLDALAEPDSGELLIVFTADHGESLGEHDYYLAHGALSYQPTARVPLIVVQPGVVEAGGSIEEPVGLLDVSATILDLAGLEVPVSFEGSSLAARLRGDGSAELPRCVFMQSGSAPDAPQLTVRHGRWKLIRVRFKPERELMEGSEYELYDLRQDPAEEVNLAARHPEIVTRLGRALERWYANRSEPAAIGRELDVEQLDPRSREMLEALGYLQTPEEGTTRAAPPRRVGNGRSRTTGRSGTEGDSRGGSPEPPDRR
jgi:arylsulfatase A-like enzyme